MTLDLELRSRTEDQTGYNFLAGRGKFYDLSRVRGGIELRPASWLTTYIQFQDTHALGLPLKYVAANMRNTFDARQAFLRIHYRQIQFTAGRQELRFGDERVIGISNWANNSRTWDGFNLRIGDRNRLDLFTASVVAIHPTSLDKHGAGLTFHGAEAAINTLVPHTSLQPFMLVHTIPRVLSQQNLFGSEVRVTFGIFTTVTLPAGFDVTFTSDLQRGTHSNNSIHAGAAILKAGYAIPKAPWKPHLQAEYDYASGNSLRDPNLIGTYDQVYPSNHNAFGLTDIFGFQNLRQERLNLNLAPRKDLSMLFQAGSLHLATVKDSIYASAGAILVRPPSGGFASDRIGTEFDASAKYTSKKYLSCEVGVGHFFPGAAMTHNAHAVPNTLAYLQLTYQFTLNKVPKPSP